MKKRILLIGLVIASVFSASSQISQNDFDALKTIYKELNGKNWTNNSGWDFSKGPESVKAYDKTNGTGWYGITNISKGQVAKLELQDNNLSGKFPQAICDLGALRTLNISGNNISGVLPERLDNLQFITSFDISRNNITGPIPAGFVEMGKNGNSRASSPEKTGTDIKLYLDKNQLSGEIPANIGDMALLHKPARSIAINFSSNKFSGNLPLSILKLTELTSIRAMNNQLTGEVPSGLADMPKLKVIRLEKNKFTGKVPQKK